VKFNYKIRQTIENLLKLIDIFQLLSKLKDRINLSALCEAAQPPSNKFNLNMS